MIYNKLHNNPRLFFLLLLITFLLAGLSNCHRSTVPDGDGSPSDRQEEGLIPADPTEFDADELVFETLFQPLDANGYYQMQCVSVMDEDTFCKEFLLIPDDVQEKSFAFTLFDVTDPKQSIVSPEPVTGVVKARKMVITAGGQEMVLKKIVLSQTEAGLSGSFTIDKRKYDFTLVRHEQPGYRIFENRYRRASHPCSILKNVEYGEAMGYWTSNVTSNQGYIEIFAKGVSSSVKRKNLKLLMDIYLPDNDTLSSRPLIVFLHGGAFYIGDKADYPITLWCKHFAACGYVVASVNYRMGFQLSKAAIERCGYSAVQDAHAAVRYLLSKKEEYRINPDYVFVAGTSAGAITSLNLAFMTNGTRPAASRKHGTYSDLGDIETSGNTLEQVFHVRAVANMWGAVSDLGLLSSSRTAIISFHGDADRLVPYDTGIPFSDMKVKIGGLFFSTMYGSAAIHRQAQKLGYRSELYTFEGAGHAPHVDNENMPTQEFYFIQSHIRDFFFKEFVPSGAGIRRVPGEPQWFRVDGEGITKVFWKVDGGFILETQGNRARVVLVGGLPHKLRASALWGNGASEVFSIDL